MVDASRGARDIHATIARHAWLPAVLLTAAMLCMGGNITVGRAVSPEVPPVALTFWRCLLAALIMLPFVYRRLGVQLGLLRENWRVILALGALWALTGHALTYTALLTTTAISASVIAATQPALTVLVAWLLLRDAINRLQGAGLALSLIGASAIAVKGDLQLLRELRLVTGDLLIALSMLSFAVYNVLVTKTPRELDPFVMVTAIMLGGCAILLPLYGVEAVLDDRAFVLRPATVGAVLYTAVFASIGAVVLMNLGIQHVGPGTASMFVNLIPVFTTVLAVTFLNEAFRLYHAAGIVMVVLGVYMSTRSRTPAVA